MTPTMMSAAELTGVEDTGVDGVSAPMKPLAPVTITVSPFLSSPLAISSSLLAWPSLSCLRADLSRGVVLRVAECVSQAGVFKAEEAQFSHTSGIPPNPITTRSLRKNPVRPTAVLASQSESRNRDSLTHGLRPRCRSAPRRSTAPSPLRRSTAAVATGSLLRSTSSPDHAFKLLPPPPRAVSDRRLAAAAPSSSVW
nr:unnamed protein product [Digitaria exilis]